MNLNKDFTISRIIVTGSGLETAQIKLNKGVNVIYGPSDTGKTYIFELINYLQGGSDYPKKISEAEGYEYAYLELKSENTYMTIKRDLLSKETFKYNGNYDDITEKNSTKMAQKHVEGKLNSISTTMLENISCPYKKIKSKTNGEVQNFTYRNYTGLTLIDEKRIMDNKSLIKEMLGGYSKTAAMSAFNTIVSGIDDSENVRKVNIDISESEKIELKLLNSIVENYEKDYKNIAVDTLSKKYMNVTDEIESIKEQIKDSDNIIRLLKEEKMKLLKLYSKNKEQLEYNEGLINKFNLLLENYQSDIERLNFIDEANHFINQFDNIKCPICGSGNLQNDNIDKLFFSDVLISEKNSLEKKVKDLLITSEVVRVKIKDNVEMKNIHEEKIADIEEKILTDILSDYEKKMNDLRELIEIQSKNDQTEYILNKLTISLKRQKKLKDKEINTEKGLTTDLEEKVTKEILEKISGYVSTLLTEWKLFKVANVKFDQVNKYDLIINEKEKASFGKGYAAIINSALSISIMLYCKDSNLPFPKFLVLDSPLVTFDGERKDDLGEQAPEEVKQKFFNYLNKIIKKEQIIIIENLRNVGSIVNLDKEINLHYFTRGEQIGRYGFFPTNLENNY